MLEKTDLRLSVTKEEYEGRIEGLRDGLFLLQQQIKKLGIPVIIVFEGWGASGKGSTISSVIRSLDPRGFDVYSVSPCNELEKRLPPLYRFWDKIPEYGNIAIFDRSWYFDISTDLIDSAGEFREKLESYDEINTFEKQLSDDGALIIKFFLHIDQKEQKQRFKKLMEDKSTSWRVTEKDRKHNKEYVRHFEAFDIMIDRTSTPVSPWHVIPATDRRYLRIKTLEIITEKIESHIKMKSQIDENSIPDDVISIHPRFRIVDRQDLKGMDLTKDVSEEEYQKKLDNYKDRIETLQNMLYQKKIPVIMVYEGWDAAGKGGNIKRITEALDPRGFEVHPIASPEPHEKARHYLWRFWTRLPKDGHIAIFDRTWYGRVMVERLEGFCSENDWRRAYNEINEFEKELSDWGAVIVKFWVHIDKDTQLARFNDRQSNPEKQWKITDEDWRNREKWDQYETAVDEMLQKTSTAYAPWHILESVDKKYARLKALRIVIEEIEKALK